MLGGTFRRRAATEEEVYMMRSDKAWQEGAFFLYVAALEPYRSRLIQIMNSRTKAAAMGGRTGSLGSASFQSLNSATGSVR
jgi:hypothetical protein